MTNGNGNGWMCVLGVDPAATGPTGYGVVESDGKVCRMLRLGALKPNRSAAAAERLEEIHALLGALIVEFMPQAVAVEAPFAALNRKTAQRLAEVRGVVLMTAAERGIPVHSYSPREVKASVAGYGAADKFQMQQMVRATLSLGEMPEPADAADALAVALCHIFAARAASRFAAAAGGVAPRGNRVGRARIQGRG